jgi:hypothetical protein
MFASFTPLITAILKFRLILKISFLFFFFIFAFNFLVGSFSIGITILINKSFSRFYSLFYDKQAANPISTVDYKIITVLIYTALAMSVVKYFGNPAAFFDLFDVKSGGFGKHYIWFFFNHDSGTFHSMLFWIVVIFLFYMIVPVLIIRYGFRERLIDYGFRFRGLTKVWTVYLLLVMIMFPVVWFASASPAFQARYPLFQPAQGHLFPSFLFWQMAYLLQFVAVEFFFRGFMVHGCKHRFGYYAVFVMVIPYCMVHFGKPFTETLAAIVAGVVLGMLSLKSRSVIPGVVVHYTVAITMDVMALWREGYF